MLIRIGVRMMTIDGKHPNRFRCKGNKVIVMVLLLAVLLCPLRVSAAEQKLPSLVPPDCVALLYLNGEDSPTTHSFSYSIDPDILRFVNALDAAVNDGSAAEFLAPYGYSDLFYTVQIDWALDNVKDKVSGWHSNGYWTYNKDFNCFGVDEDGSLRVSAWDLVDVGLVGGEMIRTVRILCGVPNDLYWNGDDETPMPGLKDQLKPSQYTYQDDTLHIDLKKHTFYIRARLVCVGKKIGDSQYTLAANSPWSETVASGKNGGKTEPPAAEELAVPVISDLHMSERNVSGNAVAAYTLTIPDELIALAAHAAVFDGEITLETQARIKGDAMWTALPDADRELDCGTMECPLLPLLSRSRPVILSDMPVELRCRYVCTVPGRDAVTSAWSQTIAYVPAAAQEPSAAAATPDEATADEPIAASSTGLYVFLVLIGVLGIVAAAIIVIKRKRIQKNPI